MILSFLFLNLMEMRCCYLFNSGNFIKTMLLIGVGRQIIYYDDDNTVRSASFDSIFHVKFNPGRFCIGHFDGKEWHYCGVETKGLRCPSCNQKDYLTKCLREERECLRYEEDHVLYLAYFGGKTVKVGITRSWRVHERLWEQGALTYTILDEGIGWKMLSLEKEVSKTFGIPQFISKKQKLRAYREGPDWVFIEDFGVPNKIEENLSALKAFSGQDLVWEPVLERGIRLGPFVFSREKAYYLPDYKGRRFSWTDFKTEGT
jgi:hypothetical protein